MRVVALALGIAALAVAGCGDDGEQNGLPEASPTAKVGGQAAGCKGGKVPEGFDEGLIVGKKLADAEAAAKKADLSIRTIYIDGKPQAATMDYNPQRMNVAVKDGVVTQFCFTG